MLYKENDISELFYPRIDELSPGVERDQLGCEFRPEFDDDDGEIVALHYDEALTQREHGKAKEEIEKYKNMLDDSE